jgi:hypothetical protein
MTRKQKKLLTTLGKHKSIEADMLAAGYAPSTARQQKEILKNPSFEGLLEQYLPDNKVMLAHEEGLEAVRIHGTNDNFIEVPDHATRLKAAELAYKVKGRLKDSVKHEGEVIMTVEIVRHKVHEDTVQ